MESEKLHGEEYRDSLATITKDGKRAWIFAKKVSGKFYNFRQLFGYFLLVFLFTVPFIKIGGEPLLLFNLPERKFILFSVIFWPQDSFLFYLMMVSSIIFVVLFTVMFGRLFCGWACPQTLFLELIFRRIEWLIDGNPTEQKKLKQQGWTFLKLFKRTLKHSIFWAVSFLIVNVLLSYIIGMDKLFQIASEPIAAHRGSFIGIVIFSSAFYFIYAWFREQVCTIMCPYGRLQGVLTDNNTITVSYDYFRGEPRGMEKKNKPEQKFGDCVDCKECIRVCPTGIDIRNGSQLECINCTACIDACNSVMTKVKKPTGLIRYSSENGLKTGKSFKFTTRNIAYTTVLTGILVFLTTLLLTRTETETTILRARGLTYQTQPDDNRISNLYNLTIVNKSHRTINASVRILSHKGNVQIHGTDLSLETGKSIEGTMIVFLEKADVKSERTKIEFGIYDGDVLIEKRTTDFIGPN